ncbi:MAG: hypothetical protein V7641_1943 [Blastocatellia bacterium]
MTCEMKVLIVEDNDRVRQMIRVFLRGLAGEMVECADGSEALSVYRQHRPDWVLMDIKMARVDGLTATREIKAAFPKAKIVIVTNFDDEAMREAAREAGAVGLVAKDNLLDLPPSCIED